MRLLYTLVNDRQNRNRGGKAYIIFLLACLWKHNKTQSRQTILRLFLLGRRWWWWWEGGAPHVFCIHLIRVVAAAGFRQTSPLLSMYPAALLGPQKSRRGRHTENPASLGARKQDKGVKVVLTPLHPSPPRLHHSHVRAHTHTHTFPIPTGLSGERSAITYTQDSAQRFYGQLYCTVLLHFDSSYNCSSSDT
ncbi:unnamed protein product [Gadus morhua 'NCC']